MHVKDKKLSAHQDMYNPENNIFVAGLDLVKVVVQAQKNGKEGWQCSGPLVGFVAKIRCLENMQGLKANTTPFEQL